MDTRSIVDALRGYFESRPDGIVCAWLFGSVARGSARPDSDVEAAIGRPVDLVVLNRAPVDLIHRVLRDGVLLVERDRNARVRFEVRARNEFFDLKPHLDRYRRAGERAHGRP